MRNPNRISPFIEVMHSEWAKLPDLRFGQLMVSFIREVGDPFYMEDDEFLRRFKEYVEKVIDRKE